MNHRAIPTRPNSPSLYSTSAVGKGKKEKKKGSRFSLMMMMMKPKKTNWFWTGLVVVVGLILVLQRTIFEEHHTTTSSSTVLNGTGTVRVTGYGYVVDRYLRAACVRACVPGESAGER